MLHILSGSGGIQVDFKNHFDWMNKIIFLEKGQYIKFLADGFVVRRIEFEDEDVFRNKDIRVLFKHLVSLGYINFDECSDCQRFLSDTVLTRKTELIDISSKQWYWQNPFRAKAEEYHVIFDVKDIIDREYKNHLNNKDLANLIGHSGLNPHALYSNKVGITIKSLLGNKRLLEGQKEIAFTEKTIQEVSYDLGYKDPAYFNRVFKSKTGQTPAQFRQNHGFESRGLFVQNLFELLREHHTRERQIDFYADKLNVSVKVLSKKVQDKLQISIGQLIRQMLIQSAKQLLVEDMPVREIAYLLGFEEANHFSSFFKHYTQITPSEFRSKKYNH